MDKRQVTRWSKRVNIVFVTGLYVPRYSAVGKCVKNLAAVMGHEHNVSVLSIVQADSPASGSRGEGGETLLYARSAVDEAKARVQAHVAGGSHSVVWHMIDRLLSAFNYAGRACSKGAYGTARTRAYFRVLEALPEDPDVLIPCAGMFENVMACVWYKHEHPATILAPILFDQFAYATSLYRTQLEIKLHRKWNLQVEDEVFAASDAVFTITWEDHIRRHHPRWLGKVHHIEHPMLIPLQGESALSCEPPVQGAVFAGTLDPSVRTADYAIEVFRALRTLDANSLPLELYALSIGAPAVKAAALNTPECIIAHDALPADAMTSVLRRSPALVSIGNRNSFQKPSKHIEYMAMGKPIIHFAYLQDDPAVKDLEHYPMALVLNEEDDPTQSAVKLDAFLKECAGREVSFEGVVQAFSDGTPERASDIILDSIAAGGGLIFSGTLGAHVDPTYFCKILRQHWCSTVRATFFAVRSPMRTKLEGFGIDRVTCRDWVLPSELSKIQQSSAALLNIAEYEGKQISSKIYEYMASGKPIVHVYTAEHDVNVAYLTRYPLSLCLRAEPESLERNARLLALWLLWSSGRVVPFEDVREACRDLTPEYVARQIMDGIA